MSAFTEFMPGGGGGPSVRQLTELINAYESLSALLQVHMKETCGNSTVHGVKDAVNEIESAIGNVNATLVSTANKLNALYDTSGAFPYYKDNEVDDLLKTKADASSLEDYYTKEFVDHGLSLKLDKADLDTAVATLNKSIGTCSDKLDTLSEHIDVSADALTKFKNLAEFTNGLIAKIKALETIDFTKWAKVTAQYAGTSVSVKTPEGSETHAVYLLGMLSEDWSDNGTALSTPKAARAYIMYADTNMFDAVVDMTVTKTGDKWTGKLFDVTSKTEGKWKNLTWHLIHTTDSDEKSHAYLGVSFDKGTAGSSYTFWIAGVNFIPLSKAPQAIQGTDNIICSRNTSYVQIGDGTEEGIYFGSRPWMPNGDGGWDAMISSGDLEMAEVPVGGIIQWPLYDELTKAQITARGGDVLTAVIASYTEAGITWADLGPNDVVAHIAKGMPSKAWLPCDGLSFNAATYPALKAVLPSGKVPLRDYSIIHAALWDSADLKNGKLPSEMTTEELKKLIEQEQLDRAAGDNLLDGKIDETRAGLQSQIDAEVAERKGAVEQEQFDRATADRNLQAAIDKEAAERKAADSGFTASLQSEANARSGADEALSTKIDTTAGHLASQIEDEAHSRTLADKDLYDKIVSEEQSRTLADAALDAKIDKTARDARQELSDAKGELSAAIQSKADELERKGREAAEGLAAQIEDEARSRTLADAQLAAQVEDEAKSRTLADAELAAKIGVLDEAAATLDANISAVNTRVDNVKGMVQKETSQRKAADEALDARVSELEGYHKGNEPDGDNADSPMPDSPIPVPGGD